jgi:hypothetical protein
MKRFSIFVVLFFLSLSTAANAHQAVLHPSQVILNPSQDSTIIDYNPDGNYGGDDTLWIGHDYGGWLDPLLQFDLSPYPGVIVESAYLWLYVYSQAGTFPPTDMWIERITGSWDEMTVTWSNFPGGADPTYISGPTSVADWWIIDAASYVNNWVSGTYDNFGFILGTADINDDYLSIYSKEYTDSNYHPQLELNFHDVSVQPTSLGSIKAIYK